MAGKSPSERRLQKELMSLIKEPPPGVTIDADLVERNLLQWLINMEGASGTLYEGESFQLQFKFSNKYPFDSPEVVFVGTNIPVHPHVYSNGHICLSILTDDWSPALSVQAVCLSIVSMLSSCKEKRRRVFDRGRISKLPKSRCDGRNNDSTESILPQQEGNDHIDGAHKFSNTCCHLGFTDRGTCSLFRTRLSVKRPPDNSFYVKTCNKNPKKTKWWYHDDSV